LKAQFSFGVSLGKSEGREDAPSGPHLKSKFAS